MCESITDVITQLLWPIQMNLFVSLPGFLCRGEGVFPGPVCSSFLSEKRKLHSSQERFVTQAPCGLPDLSELPPRILHCPGDGTNYGTDRKCLGLSRFISFILTFFRITMGNRILVNFNSSTWYLTTRCREERCTNL